MTKNWIYGAISGVVMGVTTTFLFMACSDTYQLGKKVTQMPDGKRTFIFYKDNNEPDKVMTVIKHNAYKLQFKDLRNCFIPKRKGE